MPEESGKGLVGEIELSELRKRYGRKFRNCNLHHLRPSSRGGSSHHFNLFPWPRKPHKAWHFLFLNMTFWEVWNRLDHVYGQIFDNDRESVSRDWLDVCELSNEKEKKRYLEKRIKIEDMQQKWIDCFGGEDITQAEQLLKYMMLFMVFGVNMANPELIFNNGNLSEFLGKYIPHGRRASAFNICFGENADLQTIKAKVSKILR